jgi:predicted nuclease of predicted toxin-antitoxin system
MKILIDMNLSPLWVQFLVEHGIDAIHWSTIGEPTAPDYQILDHAASNGLVVFTHDLDFGMLLAARKSRGPSVLQVRTLDVLPARDRDHCRKSYRRCQGALRNRRHRHRGPCTTPNSTIANLSLNQQTLRKHEPVIAE